MSRKSLELLDAELAAQRIIRDGRIRTPKEIDVDAIAMQLGVLVHDAELQGCEARLLRRGSVGVVRVRRGIREPGRRRFAVAHELGHWLRHSGQDQSHLCSSQDIEWHGDVAYSGSAMELEANVFAANLLMPTTMFRPRCEKLTPELQALRELAEEFQTTLTATALRYVEQADRDCMLVISEGGRVRWWKRSASISQLYLHANQQLDSRTGAAACKDQSASKYSTASVEFEAWFPHLTSSVGEKIREDTLHLAAYGKTMSFLWLE